MQFNNEKVGHVPRLLQSSMQPNAREESENEVRNGGVVSVLTSADPLAIPEVPDTAFAT